MSDKSLIEWTDATWNPGVHGCTKVSEGCFNCYIERSIPFRVKGRKFDAPGVGGTTGVVVNPNSPLVMLPTKWKEPRKIFVNSLSDLLHDEVPDEHIALVFAVIAATRRHTYQLPTKRPGRLRSLMKSERFRGLVAWQMTMRVSPWPIEFEWPLPNLWLGVSVENQRWANVRVPLLLDTPAAVRFLSCEPLLGPVDLTWCGGVNALAPDWVGGPGGGMGCPHPLIDWVIAGGESGPGSRPMHPAWARSMRDQCQAAGTAFHFKQWGEYGLLPKDRLDLGVTVANDGTVYQPGDLAYPDGPRYGEALRAGHDKASLTAMYRVGKKFAGRELDDRTWDEFPATDSLAASAARATSPEETHLA